MPDKKSGRVTVDAQLNEVDDGSPDAAFIYNRSELDRLRERREELGLTPAGQPQPEAPAKASKADKADEEAK